LTGYLPDNHPAFAIGGGLDIRPGFQLHLLGNVKVFF
jgi:hypothetical protein